MNADTSNISLITRIWLSLFLSPLPVIPVAIAMMAFDDGDEGNWMVLFALSFGVMFLIAPRIVRKK